MPMLRWSLALTLSACSYRPQPGTADSINGQPATCRTANVSTMGGLVGGAGGGVRPPQLCADDEVVVQAFVEMTDGSRWFEHIASARATFTCGRLSRPAGGSFATSSTDAFVVNPAPCDVFVPQLATTVATCASGSVMVGMRASVIPTDDNFTCFNNVAALCAPIEADGLPSSTAHAVDVLESADASLTPVDVRCPGRQVVRGVRAHHGCGLDGLDLLCDDLVCD